MSDGNGADRIGEADCEICGARFVPDIHSRCRECRGFFCRNCLKITYEPGALTGIPAVVAVRCYHCHHRGADGNEKSS